MSANGELKVRLFRYEPGSGDTPRYEAFSVPRKPGMRVLDVLNHIYDTDSGGSLAHRWYCGTKKCGECAVTVNGTPMLACWEPAVDDMTVGPLANFPIIRDLVVDTERYEKLLLELQPIVRRDRPADFPEKISHVDMRGAHGLLKCIECNVCTAAAPAMRVGPAGIDWSGYAGPGALVRFARFVLDPRDELDRRPLALKAGLKDFPLYDVLRTICPQGIDIVTEALVPAQQKLFRQSSEASGVVSTTPLIVARAWSGFVRLTDAVKQELQKAGLIKPTRYPGIDEAYLLTER